MRTIPLFCRTLAGCLVIAFSSLAAADDDGELGFDEVEEEPVRAATSWTDRIHLSGRFDINLEMENIGGDGDKQDRFRTYHNFIFVKAKLGDQLLVEAEVVDQIYYEISYRHSETTALKAGRIWVPFGLSPFHHYYGGVQGDPFAGKLVPNVWAELGTSVGYRILATGSGTLTGDTYVIRGFEGRAGSVLDLNAGGSDDVFAYGQRLKLTLLGDRFTLAASGLFNEWGTGNNQRLFLWGGDFSTTYDLLDLPILSDMRLGGAVARAEVRDRTLVDPADDEDGWYFKYGDYIEAHYGQWRPFVTLRLRYGSYVDFDDVVTGNDTHSINLAAIRRMGPLMLMAEYFWNFEEVDEVDDDLFRLHAVVDF